MPSIREDTQEFRRQLENGAIRRAYGALLAYMLGLRAHFKQAPAGFAVSGLYQGAMDMTYFALFPPPLKRRNLKIAIVFDYDAFRFEAWLVGRNRKVQRQYWELFKGSRWAKYRVVAPGPGVDSIVECDLAQEFDLGQPSVLTASIEKAAAAFIADVERYLSRHDPAGAPGRAR